MIRSINILDNNMINLVSTIIVEFLPKQGFFFIPINLDVLLYLEGKGLIETL